MKTLRKFFAVAADCTKLSPVSKVFYLRVISRSLCNRRIVCRERYASRACIILAKHKQIHSTAASNGKLFVDKENAFAHTVLEGLPVYSQTLAPCVVERKNVREDQFQEIMKADWTDETADTVYNAFETVSHYIADNPRSISDDQFDNLCINVSRKCGEMVDEKLLGILRCLRMWPAAESVETPNFANIWRAVDKECVKRIKIWDLNKVLRVSDHWYKLYLIRKSDFIWYGNFKLGKKPTRLLPHQLIQCMFYINVYRRWHPECSKYEFEYSVERCLDKLTLDEIAIFAMGFFKSQTKIHSSVLISEILARATSEVNNVHSITIAAILKVIRYSLTPSHADMLYYLLDKLQTQVSRLSLLSLVHIALAGTNVQVFHRSLMQSISQRFSGEIKSARLKDLERFALALTQYDYDPKTSPCIYKGISEELYNPSREPEIEKYPKCLPCCLYYLSMRNTYHLGLISSVLQPEFMRDAYGKNEFAYGRELLCLDIGVELECPDYKGNRLSQKTRQRITKKNTQCIPLRVKRNPNQTDKFMLEVMDNLEEILGGPDHLHALHVLPQYERPDIIFGMEDNGRPIKMPEQFRQLPLDNLKPPPTSNDGTTWYAVTIAGWNVCIRRENRPVGAVVTKIRQLKTLGYIPILVSWFDWLELHADQKKEFLKNAIQQK